MRRPSTSAGRTPAASRAKRSVSAPQPREGEIKVTRNTKRPEVKASRGPGGPARTRKVAESSRSRKAVEPTRSRKAAPAKGRAKARKPQPVAKRRQPTVESSGRAADRRVAETRRQSLSSLSSGTRPRATSNGGGGSIRAVAVGAGGGAAAAAKVVVKPVETVARPMLRVVTGGLEKIPQAASTATPVARSRMLILLVGIMAAGLIYVNVGKLEYGDGYGRYAQRSLELQRENTRLRAQIAHDSTAERIQRAAEKAGLVVPAPEQFSYLKNKRGDAVKAARGYAAPQSSVTPSSTSPSAETGAVDTTSTDTAMTDTGVPTDTAGTTSAGDTTATTGTQY